MTGKENSLDRERKKQQQQKERRSRQKKKTIKSSTNKDSLLTCVSTTGLFFLQEYIMLNWNNSNFAIYLQLKSWMLGAVPFPGKTYIRSLR